MEYEGIVYRPPSEANSLIVQITIGCSHNSCTFCSMYLSKEFRVKEVSVVIEELKMFRKLYKSVKRIFLADGDAFIYKTDDLLKILNEIQNLYPECERVSSYATPKDILNKSDQEIRSLQEHGLTLLYMGIESGNDSILEDINKGVTGLQIIEAGKKAKNSNMKLSVTLIAGLGGHEKSKEHALESSKVISAINPDYVGLLTLMVNEDTRMYHDIKNGKITLLTPQEVLKETYEFVKHLEVSNCIFRSNHASNYVALSGYLNQDQDRILNEINTYIEEDFDFKDEHFRGL